MTETRLTRIDDTHIEDHFHLSLDDECYFFYEYTSGQDYKFSQTNNLIGNLKKSPSLRGTAQWVYKERAIDRCSREFREAVNLNWLRNATVVPIPPSKTPDHPEYDDRMTRICEGIGDELDIRNIVVQRKSMDASHKSQVNRIKLQELIANYKIDEQLTKPAPKNIAIFDDVLTAGVHFKAMQTVLSQRFPDVRIVGFFIARRVFLDKSNFSDIFS